MAIWHNVKEYQLLKWHEAAGRAWGSEKLIPSDQKSMSGCLYPRWDHFFGPLFLLMPDDRAHTPGGCGLMSEVGRFTGATTEFGWACETA